MKKLFTALTIVLLLGSCSYPNYHPTNTELHNIQVVKLEKSIEYDDRTILTYYSFKDERYKECYVYTIFVDSFKVGSIRK